MRVRVARAARRCSRSLLTTSPLLSTLRTSAFSSTSLLLVLLAARCCLPSPSSHTPAEISLKALRARSLSWLTPECRHVRVPAGRTDPRDRRDGCPPCQVLPFQRSAAARARISRLDGHAAARVSFECSLTHAAFLHSLPLSPRTRLALLTYGRLSGHLGVHQLVAASPLAVIHGETSKRQTGNKPSPSVSISNVSRRDLALAQRKRESREEKSKIPHYTILQV